MHEGLRPVLAPPSAVVGQQLVKMFGLGGHQLFQCQSRHVFSGIVAGGARNQRGELALSRCDGQSHRAFVVVAGLALPPDDPDRHGRGTVKFSLPELLHQNNPAIADFQPRLRGVRAVLHLRGVMAEQDVIFLHDIIHGIAQHPQVKVDGGWMVALIVQLNGNHVPVIPRQCSGGDVIAHHCGQAVIHRQMLSEGAASENFIPITFKANVHIATAARICVVAHGKTTTVVAHAK